MRFATLSNGTRDGRLILVDSTQARAAQPRAVTLQVALDDWERLKPEFSVMSGDLERGAGNAFEARALLAPLPRAYQYCEGSTYLSHMERCRAARGVPLPPGHGVDPAVLQSGSDRFLAPNEDILLGDESWGLDLEATLAAVVGDVPQGVTAEDACGFVRLLVLTNDLTLRNVLTTEFAKGVGFFQAKPHRPIAPFAVTADGLGDAWNGRLLRARVDCHVNGERIGSLQPADDAAFHFGEVIAHAARTRSLAAGTLVGTGTISNRDPSRGFGCLAEKRAADAESGEPLTPFLSFGDVIRVEAFDDAGRSIFGRIENKVVPATEGTT